MVAEFIPSLSPDTPVFFGNEDRLPPCNLECERNILGGLLLDPGAIYRVKDKLVPEAFYLKSHQVIYECITWLHERGKPTDLTTVANALLDSKKSESHGVNLPLLAQILDSTISAVNIDSHADLVREKYILRQLAQKGYELAVLAKSNYTPTEIIRSYQAEINALEKALGTELKDQENELQYQKIIEEFEVIESLEDSARRDWEMSRLAKKYKFGSKRDLLNFYTKWIDNREQGSSYSLDEYLQLHENSHVESLMRGWLFRKEVILLHAMGGVGKTRLASSQVFALVSGTNWGDYEVDRCYKVLIIQTDQSPRTSVQMFDYQGFTMLPPQHRKNVHIMDKWGSDEMGRLKRKLAEFKPDLVVIDSLTSISSNSIYSENDIEYSRPLVRFRALADEFNCSFLILHHSNKLGQMRGTTALYNAADSVWKLEPENKNAKNGKNILTIEKSRNRAPGDYRCLYEDETWRWTVEGLIEGEQTLSLGGPHKAIIKFLKKNYNQLFESVELAQILNINENSLRKTLGELMREGLISKKRGNLGRFCYYIPSPEPDPDQPEPITNLVKISVLKESDTQVEEAPFSGSFSEENPETVDIAFDPVNPQIVENFSQVADQKMQINGSFSEKTSETLTVASDPVYPKNADQPDQPDQPIMQLGIPTLSENQPLEIHEAPHDLPPVSPLGFNIGDSVRTKDGRVGTITDIRKDPIKGDWVASFRYDQKEVVIGLSFLRKT